MRKRIGVIVGEADCEYAMELIPYIADAAARENMDTIVFANYGSYDKNLRLYSDGEKSVIRIPVIDSLEGIIVEESMLNISGMSTDLYLHLREYADHIPIVYLKTIKDRFNSVIASDVKAMKTVTEHFIKDHGFKRICHMAGRSDLEDAHDRCKGYLEAMQEAGLEVKDNYIYWGDYWYNKVGEALDTFISDGEGYPEAIVCANDYMAIGIVQELIRRGVNVPGDVCVSGYDNIEDSKLMSPALTTVEVPKRDIAEIAVDTIVRERRGESAERVRCIEKGFNLMLRDSCGCGHFDGQGDLQRKLRYIQYHNYGMDMCVLLDNGYHISFDLDGIFSVADGYFKYNRAKVGYICMCTDYIGKQNRPVEKVSSYTDKMLLERVFYLDEDKNYDSPGIKFDRSKLLPDQYFESEKPGLYFVYPIHSLNHAYGYLVMQYDKGFWPNKYTQSYTQTFGDAIDSFNIRSEYMNMDEIRRAYLTDELTGLRNRRGYEQNIQTAVDRVKRRKLKMALASIDMDGLKYTNDTFGHSEGDQALRKIADVIAGCLDKDDCGARIGGDEFAVILLYKDSGRLARFVRDFEVGLDRINRESGKPYTMHASVGICEVGSVGKEFQKYMDLADERMYVNKRKYKEEHPETDIRKQ
ncbi:MAG: GGDEF domain-containing protein [Lachnospiraceae bacterium]|nr:GGDEF domain-containing protein [Lachnospiraceae bacterium]